jgi:hypothetical protein
MLRLPAAAILISITVLIATGSTEQIRPPFDDFHIKPVTHRPCLLMDPSDIAEVRQRFEALPVRPPTEPRKMDRALYGLLYGDDEFKKQVTAEFMKEARERYSGKQPGSDRHTSYRRYNEDLYRYDIIASFGFLTEDQRSEFRDMMVAGAYYFTGDDPARFASKATPRHNGTENPEGNSTSNRWTDQIMVAALVGMNFPELPQSKAWVQYAAQQIQYQLDHGVWDGAWNEVPRYHNWTMLIYSGFFQALQRRTGIDFYQHPNVKAMLDWYVRYSSSLVRFPETTTRNPAGEPTLPVWGDSNYGPLFEVPAMYAPQYASTDPALSRRLMWMWRRAGCPFQHGRLFDLTFPIQVDPRLPDAPQTLTSEFGKRFGYVLMRSGFNTPDETVIYMRGGQRGVLHPRSDLGSIDLFSQGIPLALGSQSGPYGEGIEWNRSQQSNNVVVFGGISRDRREASGKIDAFFTSPQVDYAVADCSRTPNRFIKQDESFQWRRHLLLVKAPDYLVVWDEIDSTMASEWFLHTTAEQLIWERDRITSRTAYNADLDIHVLSPSGPLVPNEKEGRFGDWTPDQATPHKADPYPFLSLKYCILPARPGEHFITILHPRKPDAAPLAATLVSSTKTKLTLKVMHGQTPDIITLSTEGASFQRDTAAPLILPMLIQE